VVGKKTLVEGGEKLGFAGDIGFPGIQFHIPLAKGDGKFIPL
jgi:hypothetical protein